MAPDSALPSARRDPRFSDSAIDHVYVRVNQVVVRRQGGWHDAAADAASVVVSEFFRYYPA